jgi:hypothetical protein
LLLLAVTIASTYSVYTYNMSDATPDSAGSILQAFRLLDLPQELLVEILRSYRSPIPEDYCGMVIYLGEIDQERYRVLGDLCLVHRDILPVAQEELFKRLDIRSEERMDLINRSIESFERCKEYAGRAESIFLGENVNPDGLMESGALNPRELYSMSTLNFSLLSRSCLNHVTSPALTLISSKDQFQNLRRILVYEAQLDEALVLPFLETFAAMVMRQANIGNRAGFASVNLPNLRRLHIRHSTGGEDTGQIYGSIIPQIDRLSLGWIPPANLEHLLVLSTSLQFLRVEFMGSHDDVSKVHNQISRIDVKDLVYLQRIHGESSDNWETDFESIQKFKKVVEGKDELKELGLNFGFQYRARPSEIVSAQALARWKAIKGELESICVKKGIVVERLTCSLSHSYDEIWTA